MVLFWLLCVGFFCANAKKMDRPSIIIFVLNTSTRKLAALQKVNKIKEYNYVKTQLDTLNADIKQDFKTNFKFCPVYFIYDTLLDYFIQKEFDKVQFYNVDNELISLEIKAQSNVFLADINYFPEEENSTVQEGSNYAKGIVLYNEVYNAITAQKLKYTGNVLKMKTKLLNSKYSGPSFEGAAKLNHKMEHYFK
jgi:hypothetical protein